MKGDTQQDLASFMEAVASSDLENVHSRAFAWCLNQLPPGHVIFDKLLEHWKVPRDACHHVYTIPEFRRHDMVTCLKVTHAEHETWHLIIWENKIKADFSSKETTGLDLKLDGQVKGEVERYLHRWKRGISQPYWYQIRMGLWRNHQDTWVTFLEDFKKESGYELPAECEIHWLILSPFKKSELEVFHHAQWEGLSWSEPGGDEVRGDRSLVKFLQGETFNDWKFMTYRDLCEHLKNAFEPGEDQLVMRGYMHVLKSIDEKYALPPSGDENKWPLSRLHQLHDHLVGNKELEGRLDFYWEMAGSQKNAAPLFKIRMRPGDAFDDLSNNPSVPWDSMLDLSGVKNSAVDFITCSVLVQGSVKLQFAHCAYDSVKRKGNAEDYMGAVFTALNEPVASKDEKKRKEVIEKLVNNGAGQFLIVRENKPESRSGLSYSIKLKGKNKDKDKDKKEDVLCICHVKKLVQNVLAGLGRCCSGQR